MRAVNQHYWRDDASPFVELRSTYDSVHSYKPHFHSQLSFGAVIAGQARARSNGHELLLTQGDLVLIPSYVIHSCNPVDRQPRSYHMLYFDQAWCFGNMSPLHCQRLDAHSGISVIRDDELFAQYLELVAALPDLDAHGVSARTQRLLNQAVGRIPPGATRPDCEPLPERIRQALLDNLESPPSLDELAAIFGHRKETLIRVFRRAFHTTPYAYVNSARVERAKQRIKLGEEIAYVAADLGFSDQAQLHRAFVNYTASTPGQYRRVRQSSTVNFRQ
jgi:AraC-like DNA-binding protein